MDMAFALLKSGRLLSCNEIAELEQIEDELQPRYLYSFEQD